MRIYFVGSHATGKTTMTRWVSRRYGLPMITEVARSVLAELETNFDTLRTDMDRVSDYQRRVFERQIATERLQEKGFVSDRAFDNLAYAAEHSLNLGEMMSEQDGMDVRKYMEWVGEGLVFFVRPHRSLLKEDGVRAGVDWDSVVRIDGMVKLLLEQYRIRYLPIDTPSMQERVRAVDVHRDDRLVEFGRELVDAAAEPPDRAVGRPRALGEVDDHVATPARGPKVVERRADRPLAFGGVAVLAAAWHRLQVERRAEDPTELRHLRPVGLLGAHAEEVVAGGGEVEAVEPSSAHVHEDHRIEVGRVVAHDHEPARRQLLATDHGHRDVGAERGSHESFEGQRNGSIRERRPGRGRHGHRRPPLHAGAGDARQCEDAVTFPRAGELTSSPFRTPPTPPL